jgi:hypothetical protein
LGIIWSVIAFVVAAVFFLGGEWQRWTDVKQKVLAGGGSAPAGMEVANDQLVRLRGNLEVLGNRWDGEPKTQTAGGSAYFGPT